MNANLRYEIKAAAFHRMTGHMAPGKDAAPGAEVAREFREMLWSLWWKDHGPIIDAVLDAVDDEIQCYSSRD